MSCGVSFWHHQITKKPTATASYVILWPLVTCAYGGPGRLRTYDNPVMSRGLYQLSYGSNSGNIPRLPRLGKGKGTYFKKTILLGISARRKEGVPGSLQRRRTAFMRLHAPQRRPSYARFGGTPEEDEMLPPPQATGMTPPCRSSRSERNQSAWRGRFFLRSASRGHEPRSTPLQRPSPSIMARRAPSVPPACLFEHSGEAFRSGSPKTRKAPSRRAEGGRASIRPVAFLYVRITREKDSVRRTLRPHRQPRALTTAGSAA